MNDSNFENQQGEHQENDSHTLISGEDRPLRHHVEFSGSSDTTYIKPDREDRTFWSRLDYIDWYSHSRESNSRSRIGISRYHLNLIRLILMWTASSFASYFMIFENKYLEGNIYVFYYYEGITGVVASLLAQALYMCLRTRKAFIVSIALVMFGALMILLFETDVIKPEYVAYISP